MGHLWTPADDGRLEEAVTALASADLPPTVALWSAVCGRLAPELVVTPDAARSRYTRVRMKRLQAQIDAVTHTSEHPVCLGPYDDMWDRTMAMVERHESDQLERIENAVEQLSGLVLDLLGEWRGTDVDSVPSVEVAAVRP